MSHPHTCETKCTDSMQSIEISGSGLPYKVTGFGLTDPGRKRKRNEDQFLVCSLAHALKVRETSLPQDSVQYGQLQGYLFVVADGMGGHAGGEEASALVVSTIERFLLNAVNWCTKLRGNDGDAVLTEFRRALEEADARLMREAEKQPELRGMGTTATVAYVRNRDLYIAHVGDSRCYLLRKQVLYRLTRDHTLVEEMVRQKIIKPEEAAQHRLRHVVANVLGGSDEGVQVELHKQPLELGDQLLLCSDGLTEMVPDTEIGGILASSATPEQACTRLIARANENGGKDNITAVVARFDG